MSSQIHISINWLPPDISTKPIPNIHNFHQLILGVLKCNRCVAPMLSDRTVKNLPLQTIRALTVAERLSELWITYFSLRIGRCWMYFRSRIQSTILRLLFRHYRKGRTTFVLEQNSDSRRSRPNKFFSQTKEIVFIFFKRLKGNAPVHFGFIHFFQ